MCGNVLWGWGGLNNFLLVIISLNFFPAFLNCFRLIRFRPILHRLRDLELLHLKSKESYVCLCFEGECELIIHFDGSSFFWHYRFFFDLAALVLHRKSCESQLRLCVNFIVYSWANKSKKTIKSHLSLWLNWIQNVKKSEKMIHVLMLAKHLFMHLQFRTVRSPAKMSFAKRDFLCAFCSWNRLTAHFDHSRVFAPTMFEGILAVGGFCAGNFIITLKAHLGTSIEVNMLLYSQFLTPGSDTSKILPKKVLLVKLVRYFCIYQPTTLP